MRVGKECWVKGFTIWLQWQMRALIGCFLVMTLLAGCPRHTQSVFNLIVDIHVMVSCQKGYPLTSDFFHVNVC